MKFVDIKNDIAFRKIFGNENKKEILISFLNAVLGFTGDSKIVTVTILNPFQYTYLYLQDVRRTSDYCREIVFPNPRASASIGVFRVPIKPNGKTKNGVGRIFFYNS